jgi:hypothetical protein
MLVLVMKVINRKRSLRLTLLVFMFSTGMNLLCSLFFYLWSR